MAKLNDKVICTKKLHGAYKKDQEGIITKIDDEIIWINDICIAAHDFGKHFKVVRPPRKKKETK